MRGEGLPPDPSGHPDRLRWNAKYQQGAGPWFVLPSLAERALALPLPDGPVLDLACGPSGAALAAAAAGRDVTAVDVSDVALRMLAEEAARRGVAERISLVETDLHAWRPEVDRYALVLCTGFWDRAVFESAVRAVAAGGVLAWEAFTTDARRVRVDLPATWSLGPGEPACLLPGDFAVLDQHDVPDDRRGTKRRLLAQRAPAPAGHC